MPYKPKRPCAQPGCPELVRGRYCDKHAREHAKYYAKEYERTKRDPAAKKKYNAAWDRIRAAFLNAHPLCEECRREGRLTPAALVHHVKPLSEGGTHAAGNLMSLCGACHSRLHALDGSRWGTNRR